MVKKNSTTENKNRSSRTSNTWHLVTNHQNMLYMLAAGMVMGPDGFLGKHYSDPLEVFPGWIPLFRDINKAKGYIPAGALQQAVSERKHLVPCIASFDLSGLIGRAIRLKRDGDSRTVESTTARRLPNDIAQVLPAPLPMFLLRSITFRSNEDRQVFETAAGDVANVDLPDSMIKEDESLFLTDSEITWPPSSRQAKLRGTDIRQHGNDSPFQRAQAIGGLLAMLYHGANHSDLGLAVFRLATGAANNNDNDLFHRKPVLREFHAWLNEGKVGDQSDSRAKIYWGVVSALIDARNQKTGETPIDTVLAYLERVGLQEQRYKDALEQLITDIRGSLGLGGGTISEMFERHKGPLSRSLLLFCLREHSMDLLEFSHPMLEDADYILACILFGVRDGWLRLPRELRDPSLSDYVSYRMANYEHQRPVWQFAFTSPPPPPVPLRAYFPLSGREWSRKQKEMAMELAGKCDWNECIQTYIKSSTGNGLDVIENDSSQIKVRGRVSVIEKVNSTFFLERLGKWPLVPFQIQAEIRRVFECEEGTGRQSDEGGQP